jgi:hypothetical protein
VGIRSRHADGKAEAGPVPQACGRRIVRIAGALFLLLLGLLIFPYTYLFSAVGVIPAAMSVALLVIAFRLAFVRSAPQSIAEVHTVPLATTIDFDSSLPRVRPVLMAFIGAAAVLTLNLVLRLVLKLEGMPVTIGISILVGGLFGLWFGRAARRPPSLQERRQLLWWYGGLIAVPPLALYAIGSASRGMNYYALLILSMHVLAYPAALQVWLSEKRMTAFLRR